MGVSLLLACVVAQAAMLSLSAAQSLRSLPAYCHFSGQNCEPGNDRQCEQPAVVTPESCQQTCDECTDGPCVATVLADGKCQFRGCNSSCMVFDQTSCPAEEQLGSPRSAVQAPGHDLYARNLPGHFCRFYAYKQQVGAAAKAAMAEAALLKGAPAAVQGYCHYSGHDCEPGDHWQCEQPAVATPGTCQQACDKCTAGPCVATVLADGNCQFHGCSSSCMVVNQTSCLHGAPRSAVQAPGHDLFTRSVNEHVCRLFAYELRAAAAAKAAVAAVSAKSMALASSPPVGASSEGSPGRPLQLGLASLGVGSLMFAAVAVAKARRSQAAEYADTRLLGTTEVASDLES